MNDNFIIVKIGVYYNDYTYETYTCYVKSFDDLTHQFSIFHSTFKNEITSARILSMNRTPSCSINWKGYSTQFDEFVKWFLQNNRRGRE